MYKIIKGRGGSIEIAMKNLEYQVNEELESNNNLRLHGNYKIVDNKYEIIVTQTLIHKDYK